MHGQKATRNGTEGLKLIRISPYDSRTVRGFKKKDGKTKSKRAVILATAVMTLAFVCFGAAYIMFSTGTSADIEQENTEPDKGMLSEITEQEPVQVPEKEEVVVLADEQHTPRVVIDPGHGGVDGGCSRGNILEKNINLELALLLKEKVQELGLEAVLLREDDAHLTKEERVQLAQEAKADIYVSIHQNSYDGSNPDSVSGIETWYCESSQGSRRLAQLVHKGTVEKTGARDRELRETDELYVIREAGVPACLVS